MSGIARFVYGPCTRFAFSDLTGPRVLLNLEETRLAARLQGSCELCPFFNTPPYLQPVAVNLCVSGRLGIDTAGLISYKCGA
jgi:hypothetical protein